MTEKENLIAMAKRLEKESIIDDVEYPTESENALYYNSTKWHGYSIRFIFDDAGNVIEASAGC